MLQLFCNFSDVSMSSLVARHFRSDAGFIIKGYVYTVHCTDRIVYAYRHESIREILYKSQIHESFNKFIILQLFNLLLGFFNNLYTFYICISTLRSNNLQINENCNINYYSIKYSTYNIVYTKK